MNVRFAAVVLATASALLPLSAGCGGGAEPYKPAEAYSGKKPTLPNVPTLPSKQKRVGDAYTVHGAIHDLRSKVHSIDFRKKDVTIVGFIVKTNYAEAPECAVHRRGKADGPECKGLEKQGKKPLPTFWIADELGNKDQAIPVMGWTSNFAQIYDIIEAIDKIAPGGELEIKETVQTDVFMQKLIPVPLPEVGGKVRVTGRYGVTYAGGTKGIASNPKTGIISSSKIEYEEAPKMRAALPGMKLTHKPGGGDE